MKACINLCQINRLSHGIISCMRFHLILFISVLVTEFSILFISSWPPALSSILSSLARHEIVYLLNYKDQQGSHLVSSLQITSTEDSPILKRLLLKLTFDPHSIGLDTILHRAIFLHFINAWSWQGS